MTLNMTNVIFCFFIGPVLSLYMLLNQKDSILDVFQSSLSLTFMSHLIRLGRGNRIDPSNDGGTSHAA